ncbi:MFS polyamine transporter [Macrolepiota fuliginosa MF-IS2]|uniref:MFS polyamine transporter n=1 Tax=Macrolepiota fuliginosa MF-IS2 TaxID=1400762 RepID=A0A9P5X2P2_9AGAR|nr:MFS polyamine transporter [Macrolepiota fuliginosa MF-IS2]
MDSYRTRVSSLKVGGIGKQEDTIWVDFEPNDPRNPVNFSRRKKWVITAVACFATLITSEGASAYALGFDSMIRDLNCTEFQATIGLSVYPLGFAVLPMITAAASEEFGRQPLYLWSTVGFVAMFVMVALAPNIQTLIGGRFLQGCFASTGATLVGGTIADIWPVAERGFPMALFALVAVFSMGTGPAAAGWIEMNPRLQWKWIQWAQMTWSGAYIFVIIFFLRETRSSIVLQNIAKELRKKTGDNRYQARLPKIDMKKLIWTSCTRPLQLVLFEPIVTSFSLWIGFCWGVLFCLVESIPGAFSTLHNFNTGQVGTVFLTMSIGSVFGFLTNLYQEKLYKKYYPTRGTEARIITACFAAFLLPIGMFIYAWCSYPWVHWVSLCIGIVIYMWGTFIVYLSVFLYLADCYGPYASSALAGQSLARNIFATAFPLFTQQMYRKLTYKWANTLFGCVALLMLPIPFVLFYHGPRIRMSSKFSRKVIEAQSRGGS